MRRLELTPLELTRLFGRAALHLGSTCPHCGQTIGIYCTRRTADGTIRYLGCRTCGHRPVDNKLVSASSLMPETLPVRTTRSTELMIVAEYGS
jgi:hypothetical protein